MASEVDKSQRSDTNNCFIHLARASGGAILFSFPLLMTLAYAPAHSIRRGGLFFTKNPQQFDLQIRVPGYEEP